MTSLLAVKLRRDLRASWSRFVLMVIAIAVSLTVFGGVLFAWATSGRETQQAYLATEPASPRSCSTVRSTPADGSDRGRGADTAGRHRGNRPRPVHRRGRGQRPVAGQPAPGVRAVGDTLTIELPGGGSARLRVAGTMYDPSLAPAPQEQTGHGYLSTASLAAPGGQAVLDQLKL